MTRRRALLAILGLGLIGLAVAALAQPAAKPSRLGVLWPGASPPPGARTLGITIPPSIRLQADETIQ